MPGRLRQRRIVHIPHPLYRYRINQPQLSMKQSHL